MISRKNGIFVSSSRVIPYHKGQPPSLTDGRKRVAYVLMAVHAKTFNLVHNFDSVIFSRRLIIPQIKSKDLLADSGEKVVIVILCTLSAEVFVGCTICHIVCLSGGGVVRLC